MRAHTLWSRIIIKEEDHKVFRENSIRALSRGERERKKKKPTVKPYGV
jgi:hypothetical protein